MAKLIELNEAAALLGMTEDEVTTARTKGKLFGYRDGVNWKFKENELERYAASEGIVLGDAAPKKAGSSGSLPKVAAVDEDLTELVDVSELELSEADDIDLADEDESILVSEEELGGSERNAGSTIIGKEDLGADADLILAGDSTGGSDLKLAGDSVASDSVAGDDLKLAGDSELKLEGGDSEIKLEGGSEIKLEGDSGIVMDSGLSLDVGSGGASDLKLAGDSAGSNILAGDDVLNVGSSGGDDDIILDADDLSLEDDGLELSDDELVLDDDSVSSLDIDGDDDVNLLDSDITLNASDSGINLGSPSDSGISLENTPAELGGSGIEALELGEADFIELDDDDDLDLEGGTDLKADDDFLLTSADGAVSDESESGSQVIALDEADEFDEVGDTMLADADMLDADSLDGDSLVAADDGDLGMVAAAGAVAAGGAAAATIAAPVDAEYSIWNVVGLGTCLFFLTLAGVMMFDILRNMWSWNQEYALNSSIMDAIINLLPK